MRTTVYWGLNYWGPLILETTKVEVPAKHAEEPVPNWKKLLAILSSIAEVLVEDFEEAFTKRLPWPRLVSGDRRQSPSGGTRRQL